MLQELRALVALLHHGFELAALPFQALDVSLCCLDLSLRVGARLLPVHLRRELLVLLVALAPLPLPLQDLAQLHYLGALELVLPLGLRGLGMEHLYLQLPPALLALQSP